jgi:uncharacterized membrane protein YjjB (DUF3815 family)
MEWLTLGEKCLWSGLAALGFSVLFNVPQRTLLSIFAIGAAGGLVRVLFLQVEVNPVLAALAGATLVGVLSISAAHNKHSPPLVFAIPAVIPMVPGLLAYRMMIGLIKMSGTLPPEAYTQVLYDTVNNGLKVMFILMSLAGGVAIPMLLTRKESAKHLRFRTEEEDEDGD